MDFYVKLGIFQVEGALLKTNYSFFTNPPGITTSHPWPPDQGDQKCGLGVLDFVITGRASRELRGPLPCNFQSRLLDFTGGGLEPLTLHFHLLYISGLWSLIFGKPLIQPYPHIFQQRIYGQERVSDLPKITQLFGDKSQSGSFSLSHLPLCHVPWV